MEPQVLSPASRGWGIKGENGELEREIKSRRRMEVNGGGGRKGRTVEEGKGTERGREGKREIEGMRREKKIFRQRKGSAWYK